MKTTCTSRVLGKGCWAARLGAAALLLLAFRAPAATYYLSATGGDDSRTPAQAQSSSTPWRSIGRLNSASLVAGDVVLFRRGDVFRGQITVRNGITYAAYGDAILKAPVISGAELVPAKAWTLHKGSIFVATFTGPVKNVFVNHKQMTLARYPNSGFLYTSAFSTTSLTAPNLDQASSYWQGANLRICTVEWMYETRPILSHSGTTLTFTATESQHTDETQRQRRAFYLDNKLEELDAAGEWFYDAPSKQLYLYAPGGQDPNTLSVEATIYDYGFKDDYNRQNVTIRDLRIEKQALDGVWLNGATASGNVIRNNQLYGQNERGILVGGTNVRIENNVFEGINGLGIAGAALQNSHILNNTFRRIGLVAGRGISGTGGAGAVFLNQGTSANVRLAYNQVDSIGYAGLRFVGSGHTVEKNVVRNCLLTLADGAGIYTWGGNTDNKSSGHLIRDNFVYTSRGVYNGAPGGLAYGIYLDNDVTDARVVHNTVVGSHGGGILFNAGNQRNKAFGNVAYGNKEVGFSINDWGKGQAVLDNQVRRNVLYSLSADAPPLRLKSEHNPYNLAASDSNYYYNPYAPLVVQRGNELFALPRWQAATGQDARSKQNTYLWNACETATVTGSNLVSNGTFDTNLNGWTRWPAEISTTTYGTNGGLDGGALKFTMTSNASRNTAFAISPSLTMARGQWYQLRFSTRSERMGNVRFLVKSPTGSAVLYQRDFAFDPSRRDYTITFQLPTDFPSYTASQVRLDFEVDYAGREFWLDNVELVPVTVACEAPEVRSVLFTNPSDNPVTVSLGGKVYRDLDGKVVSGGLSLAAWSSQVLVWDKTAIPALANGTYRLLARHSSKALTIPQGAQANAVKAVQVATGATGQLWTVTALDNGYYQLVAQHSGKALDVEGASTNGGAKVQQYLPNSGPAQRWKIEATTNGYYKLTAECSGKSLDVRDASQADGAAVEQWPYGGGLNQQWRFEAATAARPATVSSSQRTEPSFMIFPNPAHDQFTVKYQASVPTTLRITLTDMLGRVQRRINEPVPAGSQQVHLDVRSLPAGLYSVDIAPTAPDAKALRCTIIVQK